MSDSIERWKDVCGFEGFYKVSNLGRLQSRKKGAWKVLSNKNEKKDYLRVVLKNNSFRKTFLLHRLVYEAFVGSIPKNFDVHHLDGNKQNNDYRNLIALSKRDHQLIETSLDPNRIIGMYRHNKQRRKHIIQLSLNGEYIAEYLGTEEASFATGVCARNIAQVINHEQGRTQAGGYKWLDKKEYETNSN